MGTRPTTADRYNEKSICLTAFIGKTFRMGSVSYCIIQFPVGKVNFVTTRYVDVVFNPFYNFGYFCRFIVDLSK